MMAIDVLYVLGSGSRWGNRELRYSLRSVAAHLKDVGKVYVVGDDPGFLSKEVRFIRMIDMYPPRINPAGNIIGKVLAACGAGIASRFLLMNDDFLFTKNVKGADIPLYHKGKFSDYPDSYFTDSNYRLRMGKTFHILEKKNIDALNFGIHVPMPIDRDALVRMLEGVNWQEGVGVSLRTVYGNLNAGFRGSVVQAKDPNISKHLTRAEIEAEAAKLGLLSYNDQGLNRALKDWIRTRWAEMSKYEAWPDTLDTEGAPKRRTYKLR